MTQLANAPESMREEYSTVVVGSGYGGAITAARLAEKGLPVCILERGREWAIGEFPDTPGEMLKSVRRKGNPLGLVDYYLCKDIDVLKGSGLGGTSLINLNVAFRPDPEYFDSPLWPRPYRDLAASGELWEFYARAERFLGANPHPSPFDLTKVQMVKKRADQLQDADFHPVNLTVHFGPEGANHAGVHQKPCINCGDCFPGCNVGAKNTLYMNYLPWAKKHGAEIFTQIDVRHVERGADGKWIVHYRRNTRDKHGEPRTLRAGRVVLAAGAVGSTEILLRSAGRGLAASAKLGAGFSGNGDYLGLAYNTDYRTNVMGFGNHPDSERAQVAPGPTIVSTIQYDRSKPFDERITVEDFALLPSGLVDVFRRALPGLALTGTDTDAGDKGEELRRIGKDLVQWTPDGALNHSMVYLVMAVDDSGGSLSLTDDDKVDIVWPSVHKDPIFDRIRDEMIAHATTLGGTYLQLDRFNPWASDRSNLITAHPLGGCCLGEDADGGVVDPDGRVFDGRGGVHDGLYVVDGAIVPRSIGVNPFLTISALAERIAGVMTGLAAG